MSSHASYSTVTAMLPSNRSGDVIDAIMAQKGTSALMWRARGTLLQDRWWQRWVPPISPAKTMVQMLVPNQDVSRVIDTVVTKGRLHQQATGAVFSTACDNVYFGSQYHHWPDQKQPESDSMSTPLKRDLGIIYCIVSQNRSDRVCRAAINAGAHGPIVHYCEGRGLRDRLGWLRITREHNQEVLMVLADNLHVEDVFDAMAKAGEFHRPGHGLMYRMAIESGMVNLPSRVSTNNYDVDMQQIIRAIDHLSGHAHWRDSALSEASPQNKTTPSSRHDFNRPELRDQVRMSAIVKRSEADAFSDLVLDAGAPGLTVVETSFCAAEEGCQIARARVNDEYALYRSILHPGVASHVQNVIRDTAADRGINDICVYTNPIPLVARYVAGTKDYREPHVSLMPEPSGEVVRQA